MTRACGKKMSSALTIIRSQSPELQVSKQGLKHHNRFFTASRNEHGCFELSHSVIKVRQIVHKHLHNVKGQLNADLWGSSVIRDFHQRRDSYSMFSNLRKQLSLLSFINGTNQSLASVVRLLSSPFNLANAASYLACWFQHPLMENFHLDFLRKVSSSTLFCFSPISQLRSHGAQNLVALSMGHSDNARAFSGSLFCIYHALMRKRAKLRQRKSK